MLGRNRQAAPEGKDFKVDNIINSIAGETALGDSLRLTIPLRLPL